MLKKTLSAFALAGLMAFAACGGEEEAAVEGGDAIVTDTAAAPAIAPAPVVTDTMAAPMDTGAGMDTAHTAGATAGTDTTKH